MELSRLREITFAQRADLDKVMDGTATATGSVQALLSLVILGYVLGIRCRISHKFQQILQSLIHASI